jgi:hypothetical protein
MGTLILAQLCSPIIRQRFCFAPIGILRVGTEGNGTRKYCSSALTTQHYGITGLQHNSIFRNIICTCVSFLNTLPVFIVMQT